MGLLLLCFFLCALLSAPTVKSQGFVTWGGNYYQTWGNPALVLNQTSEIQLTLNNNTGAGFESVSIYGSGFFKVDIKLPDTNSIGVATSFYLISRSSRHDEFSFQLLGGNGPPYMLATNMVLYGQGGKEQIFRLWFDPTTDYHPYQLLWNQHQVVFYVDDRPIRAFRNVPGSYYPSVQTMFLMGSIKSENQTHAGPFTARFRASKIDGCTTMFLDTTPCAAPNFYWNQEQYWELNPREQGLYEKARRTYLVYDYCSDRLRYPQQPPECRNYP